MNKTALARDIIATCLRMGQMGLNQGTAGNVSVRYHTGMLITPTGIPYEHLTERHIVFVDADGRTDSGKRPSSEWRFHQAVTVPDQTVMRWFIIMPSTVRRCLFSTGPSPPFIT